MANLSSRPHRTEPAGSYVKPDWKGYLKLALVIIFFIVLAVVFFEFIAVPKTPATTEQVRAGDFDVNSRIIVADSALIDMAILYGVDQTTGVVNES